MDPLARSVMVYAAQLAQIPALPRRERLSSENDHLALSSTVLDGVAERVAPTFRDGSVFGLTSLAAFGGIGSDALAEIVGRWFCARLNEELRSELTHAQHLGLAGEFEQLSQLFGKQNLALHAEQAARATARHLDAAGLPELADEARYTARLHGIRTATSVSARVADEIRRWTSGFGYRPYRLLPTAALAVTLATAILWLGGLAGETAFRLSLNAYFGWLGADDVRDLVPVLAAIPYAVTVASIVINSTIVALLARRWFRI